MGRLINVSLAAPIGGWNARDALGDMAADDAVLMENWFPGTNYVMMRFGHARWATGLGAQAETLAGYVRATSSKLFAIAGGNIYDVTAAGAVGAAAVSGLANSRFAFTNMTTTGGSFLVLVNGANKQQVFDGAAWHKDGDGVGYDISNVDSADLIQVNTFKSRLYYVQKNSLIVWYLGISAIAGAATKLDLSGVFQRGGYLVAMGTWTIDAGYGLDDYAVWVTSEGEVAVYQLTDPTTMSGISLKGLYWIGPPVGRRCMLKFEGDLLVIGQDGISPLSASLQSDRLDQRAQLTNKIQWAVSDAITNYGSNFGWQMIPFPQQNMLILNVPVQEGAAQQQYVMNTITKNWCKFTGWEANCWELFGDGIYFGGNGFVGRAWYTNADNGVAITANGLQAFNNFKNGLTKRATLIRPVLQTNGAPQILCSVNVDMDITDNTNPLSFSSTAYGAWDSAIWDTSLWGADMVTTRAWQGVCGVGKHFAPRLKAAAAGLQVNWVSSDLSMEVGGVL